MHYHDYLNVPNSQLCHPKHVCPLTCPVSLTNTSILPRGGGCYSEWRKVYLEVFPPCPPGLFFSSVSFFWIIWGFLIPFFFFSSLVLEVIHCFISFNGYPLFLYCRLDLTKSNVDLYLSPLPEQYKDTL